MMRRNAEEEHQVCTVLAGGAFHPVLNIQHWLQRRIPLHLNIDCSTTPQKIRKTI